ncbi:glutaredoxin family protein [Pseudodesulfovibrio sediminis]|uniref:NrdH-redoxin n=1 Tax=Pseudodesulfovibrio sediminis TaxID=2810563 RepID=A0ABM9SDV3_9BACT|nr:glutaredoxin family protein [Pseudodesulfovibrio sediminis]BCS89771.1 NrdH-redoxin [Pseudodesulfovibrio sediminis]
MSKDVTLYALSTCVHCHNTRDFLTEMLGIDGFKCVFTDRLSGDERNDTMRMLRSVNSELSFPTIVIGDDVVLGFKKDKIRELVEAD